MLDICGFQHRMPSYRDLYRQTLLSALPPAAMVTNLDIYCMTHSVFYLTDFGSHSAPLSKRCNVATVELAETLLLLAVLSGDMDLVAELLLAVSCLGSPPGETSQAAWSALVRSQLPDGAIAGPWFDPNGMSSMSPDQARKTSFEHCYHTTVAALLAWSVGAGRGEARA